MGLRSDARFGSISKATKACSRLTQIVQRGLRAFEVICLRIDFSPHEEKRVECPRSCKLRLE